MRSSQLRTTALALFFFGGASALVYEVTWVRLLSLGFGVSVYAISAVLTAFMGGLALGSWLFGRVAARIAATQPGALLRLYALLQFGAGLCALLAPVVFGWLTALYVWVYREFAPDFYLFNLLRFGMAALVLLLPTTLMGGTLPVMSQLLARQEQRRSADLGALYAANTFGGVVGACATGLLLIRWLGVQQTHYLAAAIDWICAGAAFALASDRPTTDDRRRTQNREPPRGYSTENRGRKTNNKEQRTKNNNPRATSAEIRNTQQATAASEQPSQFSIF